jgi:hypothetical protein
MQHRWLWKLQVLAQSPSRLENTQVIQGLSNNHHSSHQTPQLSALVAERAKAHHAIEKRKKPMLVKPVQTLVTAQDVIEYLWELLCESRKHGVENHFDLAYDRALNDVMYHLMRASPDSDHCICADCAIENPMLTSVNDVLYYLFNAICNLRSDPLEDDFQRGYDKALYDLMHQVWLAAPVSAKSEYTMRKKPEGRTGGAEEARLVYTGPSNKAPMVTKDDASACRGI